MEIRSKFAPPYTIGEQCSKLRAYFPEIKCQIKRNVLLGQGEFIPSPIAETYAVRFRYELINKNRCALRVTLYGNNIKGLTDSDFPHHFAIRAEKREVDLCLYRYAEFNCRKYLAETVIPWTMEWLSCYEGWLITGKWYGGGEHGCKKAQDL